MATNYLPPSIPASIPNTGRLPDTRNDRRDEKTKDPTKKEGPNGSVQADAGNTGLFQRLPDATDGGGNSGGNTGDNGGGSGNTAIAQAVSDLSHTGMQRVANDVVGRLTGRKTLPELEGVTANIAGASTFGTGKSLLNEKWMASYSSLQGDRPTQFAPISEDFKAQLQNGTSLARINAGGVNPLAILRDKALGTT